MAENWSRLAKALVIYRIEKPRNPENRSKIGKIWENPVFLPIFGLFFLFFAYFSPIFWISGFFLFCRWPRLLQVKTEVFEKRVFEQTAPSKKNRMKGAISLIILLVGTVRPPDQSDPGPWVSSTMVVYIHIYIYGAHLISWADIVHFWHFCPDL